MVVIIKKLHPDAVIPSRGSQGAAGYDLHSVVDVVVAPGERAVVDTGVAIEICQKDVYARVAPRSGLAVKNGIDVLAGVIDSDYRDSIKVVLINHGKENFSIMSGNRIAQLVFESIVLPKLVEGELTDTVRGTGGFGSTGV